MEGRSSSLLHDDNQGPMLTEAESFSIRGFKSHSGCHCPLEVGDGGSA